MDPRSIAYSILHLKAVLLFLFHKKLLSFITVPPPLSDALKTISSSVFESLKSFLREEFMLGFILHFSFWDKGSLLILFIFLNIRHYFFLG